MCFAIKCRQGAIPGLFAAGFLWEGNRDFFLSVLLLFLSMVILNLVLGWELNISQGLLWSLAVGPLFLRSLWLLLLFFLCRGRGGILLCHLLGHQLGVYPGLPVGPFRVHRVWIKGGTCVIISKPPITWLNVVLHQHLTAYKLPGFLLGNMHVSAFGLGKV